MLLLEAFVVFKNIIVNSEALTSSSLESLSGDHNSYV